MTRELSPVCKFIHPIFMSGMERVILQHEPKDRTNSDLIQALTDIARGCGYEKIEEEWIAFPKQDKVLNKLCPMGICKILEEHGDGDLTVKAADGLYVITTDGKVFKQVEV